MVNLHTLQSAVRDVVLGGDAKALEGQIYNDGIHYAQRLQVHRNNTNVLLGEALAANFPIIHQLVGEEFFVKTASCFLRLHPPQSPCLFEYGAGFADFLDSYPPVRDLPYLADMARLERAWNEALLSRESSVLDASELATTATAEPERLHFEAHPALRLMGSDYPLDQIWALHQDAAEQPEHIDLDSGGAWLAVVRPEAKVAMISLSPGGFALAGALAGGASLAEALAAGDTQQPGFNSAIALATLVNAGAFKCIHLS